MARLSRTERKQWEERLSRWQTPDAMLDAVRELHEVLELDMFIQAGLQFAREGWVAAKFAIGRGASSVRLVIDSWPDIETRDAEGIHRFEVVEADLPGRERSREYKETQAKDERGESTTWLAPMDMQDRSALVGIALRGAVQKKAEKRYSGRCGLIVMLNFGAEFGHGVDAIRSILHSATAQARDSFDEIWLLWRDDVGLLWRNGERVD